MSTLQLPPGVEIRLRNVDRIPGHSTVVQDLMRNGIFVIGAGTAAQLETYLQRLVATDWRYLFDYGLEADPLAWLDRVRLEAWTFTDFTRVEMPDERGRGHFSGNINEYSAAFSFWIWDRELLQEIRRRVPEVPVNQERPACRIVVAE